MSHVEQLNNIINLLMLRKPEEALCIYTTEHVSIWDNTTHKVVMIHQKAIQQLKDKGPGFHSDYCSCLFSCLWGGQKVPNLSWVPKCPTCPCARTQSWPPRGWQEPCHPSMGWSGLWSLEKLQSGTHSPDSLSPQHSFQWLLFCVQIREIVGFYERQKERERVFIFLCMVFFFHSPSPIHFGENSKSSFFWEGLTLLFVYTTFPLSVPLWMDILSDSTSCLN